MGSKRRPTVTWVGENSSFSGLKAHRAPAECSHPLAALFVGTAGGLMGLLKKDVVVECSQCGGNLVLEEEEREELKADAEGPMAETPTVDGMVKWAKRFQQALREAHS